MSRSKKIFAMIQKGLPGIELCKDMLVVPPTEHILRGFLIENTTERGRVYVWRVVTPLHRPMSSIILDYSDRIPQSGGDIYIKDTSQESANAIRAIVGEHLGYLRGVRRPEDFFRHIARMIGNSSINFRFDLALTYYRIGDIGQCRDMLRILTLDVDKLDRKLRMPVDQAIKQAADQMASEPDALGRLLDRWENENIERLGLLASRRDPSANSGSARMITRG
jgi:hypothetical protein